MGTTFLWRNLLKCLPSTSPNAFIISQPDHPPPPSSSSAAAAVVFNTNYNSLYDASSSLASTSTFSTATATTTSESDSDDSLPPDFATVLASQRFFFSSPGRSNSISDSYNDKAISLEPCRPTLPPPPLEGGVAVNKYSPDPYADFKKSMEEMIEARRRRTKDDGGARADDDWEYLNELLTCYLRLNPEHAHKYIISAFADIVVHLLSSSSEKEEDKSPPDSESRRRQKSTSDELDIICI